MGILLVYDVTDEQSFLNIRNWIKNIEEHASENVNRILLGNKCDLLEKKVIAPERGRKLAEEFNIDFVETSAKNNIGVEEAFFKIARAIKSRLIDSQEAGNMGSNNSGASGLGGDSGNSDSVRIPPSGADPPKKKNCC